MAAARSRRGGPLVALALVLGCWVGARVAFASYGGPPAFAEMPGTEMHRFAQYREAAPGNLPAPQPETTGEARAYGLPSQSTVLASPRFAPPPATAFAPLEPARQQHAAMPPEKPAALPVSVAASHQLMWMAALSRLPLPAGFAVAPPRAVPAPFYPAGASRAGSRRWSADGWLLLRRGAGGSLAAGPTPATYGASQAGAVLRYRLSPQSGHRPEAYLRLSSALKSSADKEAAIGLSARPLPALPLRAMAELRLSDHAGITRLRPAALVVTELRPLDLPYATRAEFYGQAGYVGGRNATPFADGQARIDKRIAQLGKAELARRGGRMGRRAEGSGAARCRA